MDDNQTRETLDFLGDLYLTGTKPDPADDDDSLADQLDGPKPLRFSGHAVSSHAMSGNRAHAEAHVPRRRPTQAKPSRVEAVYLGNLPGFGGPWLTQYAHALAEAVGPVVVMHVDDEQIDLELIGTAAQRNDIEQLAHAGNVPASEGLVPALMAMTRPRLPAVGAYLVHLPIPVSETTLRLAPMIERWTMLCSSDQMAVVSAYSSIKELVEADGGETEHGIGLMVMGAEENAAREASERLQQTAGAFLDQPIELVGWRRQMVPVQIKALGSFEAGPAIWPRIEAFLDEQGGDAEVVALPLHEARQPEPQAEADEAPSFIDTEPPTDEERAALRAALEEDDEIGLTPFVDEPTDEERQAVREAMAQAEAAKAAKAQPPREQPKPQPQAQSQSHATPESVLRFVSRLKQEDRTVEPMQGEHVVITGEAHPPEEPQSPPQQPQPQQRQPEPQQPPAEPVAAPQPPRQPQPQPQPQPAVAHTAQTFVEPKPKPQPAPAQPPTVAPADGELRLVRFLPRELQALAMDARAPEHPHVQIVIDRDAKVHLLARHAISARSLNDAMMELMQARQWVRRHASLLQMTQPQLRIDAHAEPVIHLFTADAKAAAALVGHVDDTTKLHLLQQVHVGDASSWFATELN